MLQNEFHHTCMLTCTQLHLLLTLRYKFGSSLCLKVKFPCSTRGRQRWNRGSEASLAAEGTSVDTPVEAVPLWLPKTPASQLCSSVSAYDCPLSWPAAPMACASSLCHFHSHAAVPHSAPKSFPALFLLRRLKTLYLRSASVSVVESDQSWLDTVDNTDNIVLHHCVGVSVNTCALPLCTNRNLRAVAILFGGHQLGVGVQSKPSFASPLKLFMGSSPDGCMR